jgi:hypothetical protein
VLVEACGAAASYFHHFQLPPSWKFVAAEVPIAKGRMDLVFRQDSGRWLVDDLKFGIGRGGIASVRSQIDRYNEAGVELWGAAFVGVRMCAVAEPLASRLYVPGRHYPLALNTSAALTLEDVNG